MLDWFQKKRDADVWPILVAQLFGSMKSECHGAAYLFAGSLYNYHPAFKAPTYDPPLKAPNWIALLKHIDDEMVQLSALGGYGDEMCGLGLRFVKAYIRILQKRDQFDKITVRLRNRALARRRHILAVLAYTEISPHGNK
jgi:hypothetical protein